MKDIFITGTFRNDWNKQLNLKLADAFENKGISVFLPQRDSEQRGNRKETFLQDIQGIEQSKIIVAIGSRTQTANWGFEIGYAFKAQKPVIILTDTEHPIELMPEGASKEIIIVKELDDISDYIGKIILAVEKCLIK